MNILDIILFKYPGIERVAYWGSHKDGTPWKDLYEGLIWENTDFPKPSKEDLAMWAVEASQYQQNKLVNQSIYDQLYQIDLKSIRALRSGDTQRITELESQAAVLRAQLLPTE
jgi:hypothetical protein